MSSQQIAFFIMGTHLTQIQFLICLHNTILKIQSKAKLYESAIIGYVSGIFEDVPTTITKPIAKPLCFY